MYELNTLQKHFGSNPRYATLLNELDIHVSKHNELPYQKDLLRILPLKRLELIKLMNELYRDFQQFMSEKGAYIINETEIQFIINDSPQMWVVSPDKLTIIPRIGESIHIPTLTRDHIGASYFRVKEIIHDISEGKHVVEIHASN